MRKRLAKGCFVCDRQVTPPRLNNDGSYVDLCNACRDAFERKFGCNPGALERWIAKRVWAWARQHLSASARVRARLDEGAAIPRPKVRARIVGPAGAVEVWSDSRDRWVKGHPCVMVCACPYSRGAVQYGPRPRGWQHAFVCGAKKGEPCNGAQGGHSETHAVRRDAASKG